ARFLRFAMEGPVDRAATRHRDAGGVDRSRLTGADCRRRMRIRRRPPERLARDARHATVRGRPAMLRHRPWLGRTFVQPGNRQRRSVCRPHRAQARDGPGARHADSRHAGDHNPHFRSATRLTSPSMDLTQFSPSSALVTVVVLALAPFVAVMVTSFTKIVVVLSLLRNALGLQQVPPNVVLNGMAIVLTVYVMFPVGQQL